MPAPDLPIEPVLPALREALRAGIAAVLQAPPGAGKTTRVPLALLGEPWLAGGRIVILEGTTGPTIHSALSLPAGRSGAASAAGTGDLAGVFCQRITASLAGMCNDPSGPLIVASESATHPGGAGRFGRDSMETGI